MRRVWPWYAFAVVWLLGVVLLIRMALDSHVRIGKGGSGVLGFAFLFVGLQFLLHARWQRRFAEAPAPSEGARFYFILGMIQLALTMGYLDVATAANLTDLESLSSLLFCIATAHGLLETARRLAFVPDADQRDARKMDDLGLPARATDEEMTRIAIIVMALGVLLTILASIWLLSPSYDASHVPWWLAVPTLIVIGIAIGKRIRQR